MLDRIIAAVFCTMTPLALFADPVELRSPDEKVSFRGEIIGYDGEFITVETSFGVVSVVASEVICYGGACLSALGGGTFGPTSDAPTDTVAATGDLRIGYNSASQIALFEAVASAVGATDDGVDVSDPSVIVVGDAAGGDDIQLLPGTGPDTNAAVQIASGVLAGDRPVQYAGAQDWAITGPLSHQMLALDALSVIIAPTVGIETISIGQIAGIYAGEITNWAEIGGPDQRILPLQTPQGDQIRTDLDALIMQPAGKEIAASVLTMADDIGIAGSIPRFPGSISVVSTRNVGSNTTLSVTGACGITVAADPFNLASGDYPLMRPITAQHNPPLATGPVTTFFDAISRPAVRSAAVEDGYVDISLQAQSVDIGAGRINGLFAANLSDVEKPSAAGMFQELFGASRLSTTLVGGAVSGPEGAWNRAQFQLLRSGLQSGAFAGRDLVFVGFTQSTDGPAAELDISRLVANDARDAFARFAPEFADAGDFDLSAYGFGGVAAPTCFGGQVAGPSKSRVEVWLR